MKVLPATVLCKQSNFFNAGMLAMTRGQSRTSLGKALVVVHPLFTQRVDQADLSFLKINHPKLFDQVVTKNYDAYRDKLENYLKNTDKPTFVLAEERSFDEVHDWLIKLKINRDIFMVQTDFEDPTPRIEIDSERTYWQIFSDILKAADISHVSLAGELAYIEHNEPDGCIISTLTALSPFLPVEVLHTLTFPGI